MIAKQYVVQATDTGIRVVEREGKHENSGHFFYHDSQHPMGCYVEPGLYASVPGRLMTSAKEIAESRGVDYEGLQDA
jgi:hypothetical protein